MDAILELLASVLELFGSSEVPQSGSSGELLESGSAVLEGSVQ
ncbi:hypothetical protein [Rhodococcus sp. CH91]|nr:hypothetical protein [Rhodococcus sp. CH91]